MQITRYQQPLTTSAPPSPLARPIRRRSFQNEVLIEKYDRYLMVIKVRHPPRSGWLGEWGRLKGGCPVTFVVG